MPPHQACRAANAPQQVATEKEKQVHARWCHINFYTTAYIISTRTRGTILTVKLLLLLLQLRDLSTLAKVTVMSSSYSKECWLQCITWGNRVPLLVSSSCCAIGAGSHFAALPNVPSWPLTPCPVFCEQQPNLQVDPGLRHSYALLLAAVTRTYMFINLMVKTLSTCTCWVTDMSLVCSACLASSSSSTCCCSCSTSSASCLDLLLAEILSRVSSDSCSYTRVYVVQLSHTYSQLWRSC